MPTVNTYLTFNGDCEAAFDFYKSVFGGEYAFFGRFKEMPADENQPMDPGDAERVMHVMLPISAETNLMGSDVGCGWAPNFKAGNNFSVSINASSTEEADRFFNGLSQGGTIIMPMEKTFWGAYFGMFTDKFGIGWMINHDEQPKG